MTVHKYAHIIFDDYDLPCGFETECGERFDRMVEGTMTREPSAVTCEKCSAKRTAPESSPSADAGALWKQRYLRLCQFMDDARFDIEREEYEASKTRNWDPSELLYVGFNLDCTQNEENAIETFGESNYDVYKLVKRGRD